MTEERNIKWITFRQHLVALQKDIFENVAYSDCILKVEGRAIFCHRAVLSYASDYFAFLIKTAPTFEPPTFIIADYDYALIRDIVVFIYTGEVYVEQERYEMFKDACIALGLKSFERKRSLDRATQAISKRKAKTENPLELLEEVQVDEIVLPEFCEPPLLSSDDDGAVHQQSTKKRKSDRAYDGLDLECATKEIEGGQPVKLVALKYNIPRNTLYAKVKSPYNWVKQEKLENVDKAIKEILETDISIRKAAQKYQLSKTNLWFHFKHYKETHDTTGGNLRQIKKPNRTLQKIKKNLQAAQQSQPATTIESLRQKAVLFKQRLQSAISDCKNGGSLAEVSEKYGIPEETIYRNVKNMNLAHIEVVADVLPHKGDEELVSETVVDTAQEVWWTEAGN